MRDPGFTGLPAIIISRFLASEVRWERTMACAFILATFISLRAAHDEMMSANYWAPTRDKSMVLALLRVAVSLPSGHIYIEVRGVFRDSCTRSAAHSV